jgi:hypothetical protein
MKERKEKKEFHMSISQWCKAYDNHMSFNWISSTWVEYDRRI